VDRLGLAIRKPEVTGTDVSSIDISFGTGPSLRVFNYTVKCVAEGEGCGAEAVGTPFSGDLTRTISTVDATVTGLFPNTTYFCYVAVSGDKVDKCQGPLVATTAIPGPANAVGTGAVAGRINSMPGIFKYDILSTDPDTIIELAAIETFPLWMSLSGLTAAMYASVESGPKTATFYYVNNFTAWNEGTEDFPNGWTAVSGANTFVDALDNGGAGFDISGTGIVAWKIDGTLLFLQDFTVPNAEWDYSKNVGAIYASLDGDRAAAALVDNCFYYIVLYEDIWSSSRTMATVVNLADADLTILGVSLSGPYLAYVTSDGTDTTLNYVDLSSVDDFSAGLPTPVEVPLPQAWTDDGYVAFKVSIALTEMVVIGRKDTAMNELASTADFRSVTPSTWTEFGDNSLYQVDISFPDWPKPTPTTAIPPPPPPPPPPARSYPN
jgi:hypothetical protein